MLAQAEHVYVLKSLLLWKLCDMTRVAKIELRGLELPTTLGTYGPQDVIPDAHILDLTLSISPELVQITADDMALIFDYDPLIAEIERIAGEQKYETQEFLMTRIIKACAGYAEITALDIFLKKQPVLNGTGSLGVRLVLGVDELMAYRAQRSQYNDFA